jgi:hypothetical protein
VNQGPNQQQVQVQRQGGSLSYPYQYPYPRSYTPSTGRYVYDRYGRVVYEYGGYEQEGGAEWSYEYLCYRFPYLCQPLVPFAYARSDHPDPMRPPRPVRPIPPALVQQAVQRQVVQQVPVARESSLLRLSFTDTSVSCCAGPSHYCEDDDGYHQYGERFLPSTRRSYSPACHLRLLFIGRQYGSEVHC